MSILDIYIFAQDSWNPGFSPFLVLSINWLVENCRKLWIVNFSFYQELSSKDWQYRNHL